MSAFHWKSQMHPFVLRRLTRFLGYGQPYKSIWFIGMEEAAISNSRVSLASALPAIADLKSSHVRRLHISHHHIGKRKIQPSWRVICRLMLRLKHRSATREQVRRYQAVHLGRLRGETFLTDLLPLPKPSFCSWPYAAEFPSWPNLGAYHRGMLPRRKTLLKAAIRRFQPKLVVAYGKSFWAHYKDVLGHVGYRRSGPFEVRGRRRCGVPAVLMPHTTSRAMNSKLSLLLREVRRVLPRGDA